MAQEFRKRQEEEELIKRYEENLKHNHGEFFDIDSYETIIGYYLEKSKFKRALTAVDQAIDQYPFSTELLTVKAQIFTNLERYEEALELLERSRNLHPHDLEVYLSIGSILSLQGKYEEAIALYEETLAFAEEEQDEIYYNIGLAYQSMEKYEQAKGGLKGLLIGEVLSTEKHPNADKLTLTKVPDLSGASLLFSAVISTA